MIAPNPSIGANEVADHYDRLNEFYVDVWGLHRHHGFWNTGRETADEAVALMSRKILEATEIQAGSHVVDVGCGTGGVAWFLAEEAKAEVVGYTVSKNEKKTAEEHEGYVVDVIPKFVCSDWLHNELPDESADAVVLIESLSHMTDRKAALTGVERVLKPGGRLVMADWFAASDPPLWQVKALLEPICRGGRLAGLSTEKENRELLESLSMQSIEMADITGSVSRTWRVIAGRLMGKALSDGCYRKLMWQSLLTDRDMAFAIPRVITAYAIGCLRYEWIVAQKKSAA